MDQPERQISDNNYLNREPSRWCWSNSLKNIYKLHSLIKQNLNYQDIQPQGGGGGGGKKTKKKC
jgi:hypothetical protein